MDEFDLKLLRALQEDGRLTNNELGDRVGLSASHSLPNFCSGPILSKYDRLDVTIQRRRMPHQTSLEAVL